MNVEWRTSSPEETRALGPEIVRYMGGRGVLLLEGDLGAGKTCLVQGIALALGIEEAVTSPTYSLVKTYGDPECLVHADLYRLSDADELLDLGLEEWLDGPGIFAVEWPSRSTEFWRTSDWHLEIHGDAGDPQERTIRLWREDA